MERNFMHGNTAVITHQDKGIVTRDYIAWIYATSSTPKVNKCQATVKCKKKRPDSVL